MIDLPGKWVLAAFVVMAVCIVVETIVFRAWLT